MVEDIIRMLKVAQDKRGMPEKEIVYFMLGWAQEKERVHSIHLWSLAKECDRLTDIAKVMRVNKSVPKNLMNRDMNVVIQRLKQRYDVLNEAVAVH